MNRHSSKTEDNVIFKHALALVEELHDLEVQCQEIKTELLRQELTAFLDLRAALTETERREVPAPQGPGNEEQPENFPHRLMRLKEIIAILGISRSTWYQGIKTGVYQHRSISDQGR